MDSICKRKTNKQTKTTTTTKNKKQKQQQQQQQQNRNIEKKNKSEFNQMPPTFVCPLQETRNQFVTKQYT